jgi:hypothetical protein
MIILVSVWLGPLDNKAIEVVDTGLKRAVVSFASARTLNAVLSVVQSAEFSATPFGFGGSLTLGQALHPFNEIVGQFAELMLAASVAFGVMKFLIVLGGAKGVSALLSIVALWWAWLRWQGKERPALLSKTLLVLVLFRFSVPVASTGSEVVFQQLFEDDYKAAQASLQSAVGLQPNFLDWVAHPTTIPNHVNDLKQAAEKWVRHIVDLIVLFLMQTLVVPLLLFWILYLVGRAILISVPRSSPKSAA